jgi:hypothetical protein
MHWFKNSQMTHATPPHVAIAVLRKKASNWLAAPRQFVTESLIIRSY